MRVVWVLADGDIEFCESVEDAENAIDDDEPDKYVAAYAMDGTKYVQHVETVRRRFWKDGVSISLSQESAPDGYAELREHLLAYLERHAPHVFAEIPEDTTVADLVARIEQAPSGWHDDMRQAAGCAFGFGAFLFGMAFGLYTIVLILRLAFEEPVPSKSRDSMWDWLSTLLMLGVFIVMFSMGFVGSLRSYSLPIANRAMAIALSVLSLALYVVCEFVQLTVAWEYAAKAALVLCLFTAWVLVKSPKQLFDT